MKKYRLFWSYMYLFLIGMTITSGALYYAEQNALRSTKSKGASVDGLTSAEALARIGVSTLGCVATRKCVLMK